MTGYCNSRELSVVEHEATYLQLENRHSRNSSMIVAEGAMKARPTTIAEADLKLKEEVEPNIIEESEA